MARKSKYKLHDSDRSGFTFKEIELVKDKGVLVGPGEFDSPPPSNKSLGGEGIILNPDARVNATTSYSAINIRTTYTVTAAGGITFVQNTDSQQKADINNQWIYVSGSTATVNITANPQISAGYQNAIITIQCVSNSIILEDGNGLNLPTLFNMDSGSIINLIYNATDNLWHETSRSHITGRFV